MKLIWKECRYFVKVFWELEPLTLIVSADPFVCQAFRYSLWDQHVFFLYSLPLYWWKWELSKALTHSNYVNSVCGEHLSLSLSLSPSLSSFYGLPASAESWQLSDVTARTQAECNPRKKDPMHTLLGYSSLKDFNYVIIFTFKLLKCSTHTDLELN